MRERIKLLADRLVRKGLRRGVLEGSDLWLAVGAVAFLVRLVARKDKPSTVTEHLKVGESIVVTHLPAPPTGRAARRAAAGSTPPAAAGA